MSPRKKRPKSASETAKVKLVPRPDGRGALLTGGVPGNAGGGRPPSLVRAALRESFFTRIHILEAIADDGEAASRDRLQALMLMATFGLKEDDMDLLNRLKRQVELIGSRETWTREELFTALGEVWS